MNDSEVPRDMVPVEHYSAALDEIYRLRVLMAYQAQVAKTALGYKTMPASVRSKVSSIERSSADAAKGEIWQPAYPKTYLRAVGAHETMTRWEWEQQRGL